MTEDAASGCSTDDYFVYDVLIDSTMTINKDSTEM